MTKPRPVGRPARSKSAAVRPVTIRLTEKERTRYAAAASRSGLTLSEWLRAAAEMAMERGAGR